MVEPNFVELDNNIDKVIKKNKIPLRLKVAQLAKGELTEEDFLIYIITEFTRMHTEISGYSKIFVKRQKHLLAQELIEDNIKKAAIIETLAELLPQNATQHEETQQKSITPPTSDLLYSTEIITQ